MLRSKVYMRVNRVNDAVCDKARAVTVSDLHEALYATGDSGLMSSAMRPRLEGARIVGPAVTAYCAPGDNLMMHRALYLAEPGDVLVVVCAAPTSGAQWGDVATRYALKKGLAGVVVHGSVRDTDTVRSLGFPVWSTHVSSIHPDKCGHGWVNAPIVCDGVTVNPGDLIVADGDGVLRVPKQCADEVVDLAIARMRKEDEAIEAIANGTSVWEFSGAAASYAGMSINELDQAFDDGPSEVGH